MDGLVNLIGFRYCGVQEPSSGLYLNDIAGISIKSLDKIANEEQVTFFELWKQIERRSINLLHTSVVNSLRKRYKISRESETEKIGTNIDSTNNQTPHAAEWRGIIVTLSNKSLLQFISIQNIKLYVKNTATVAVKAFEVLADNSLIELKSITTTCAIGFNYIGIDGNFSGVKKIFIAHDATEIDSVSSTISSGSYTDCCSDCIDICNHSASVNGARIAQGSNVFSFANNTFGLSADISIQCDFTTLLCATKNLFAAPLLYLGSREIMNERIYSDRLNRYTTIDAKKARELRDEYNAQFVQELESVLNGIELNTSDCCISCNALVTLQSNLP